jgi:hypothetical protein
LPAANALAYFKKEIDLGKNQCDQMIEIKIGPFLKK